MGKKLFAEIFLKELIVSLSLVVFVGFGFQAYAQNQEMIKLMSEVEEEVAKIEQSGKVNDDLLLNEYINSLGHRLLPKDVPAGMHFNFRVIEDPTLNAFAFPNGAIYMHSGILARLENEAQLATILGHEIVHVLKGHTFKGIQQKKKVGIFSKVVKIAAGEVIGRTGWQLPQLDPLQEEALSYAGNMAILASVNGYGRSQEDEADRIGLKLMFEAGFDPREAPKPFNLLLKTYGDSSAFDNFFYGSHSRNKARIKHLNKLLKKEYNKKMEGKEVVTNSTEFQRRMRVLIRDNAILDYYLKRYQLAKEGLNRTLQILDKDYIAHYYLGNVYRSSGRLATDIDKALEEYERTIEIKPDYPFAYRELGLVYYRKEKYKEAIDVFEKYLELEPEAPDGQKVKSYIDEMKMY